MKKWKRLLAAGTLVLGVGAAALPAQPAAAIDVLTDSCEGNKGVVCSSKNDDASSLINVVINMAFYVLGMIAAVMIVVGGIRYATSQGDASAIKSAKDTILYSVIGLVVAILSFVIVNFVLSYF